jgi:hypothetical protein
MRPPYFRAHSQVRPYENIENYTWDTTLVSRFTSTFTKLREKSPPPLRGGGWGEGDKIQQWRGKYARPP